MEYNYLIAKLYNYIRPVFLWFQNQRTSNFTLKVFYNVKVLAIWNYKNIQVTPSLGKRYEFCYRPMVEYWNRSPFWLNKHTREYKRLLGLHKCLFRYASLLSFLIFFRFERSWLRLFKYAQNLPHIFQELIRLLLKLRLKALIFHQHGQMGSHVVAN